MLKADELRIGNILTHVNGNGTFDVVVTEVLKNGVNVTAKMQLGEWFLRYEELQGAQLTADRLFKFGFRCTAKGDDFDTYDLRSVEVWEHDERFCHSYSLGGDVLYVHQIQNLYFALTGEELSC